MGTKEGIFTLSLLWVLVVTLAEGAVNGPMWQKINGVLESEIQSIAVNATGHMIYFASDKSLYQTQPRYQLTQRLATLPSSIHQVHQLSILPTASSTIYLLTDDGVYSYYLPAQRWQKEFESSAEHGQDTYDMIQLDDLIYLASSQGIFLHSLDSNTWRKINNFNEAVYRLAANKDYLYAVTSQDVYRMERMTKTWQKIFHAGINVMEEDKNAEDIQDPWIKDLFLCGDDIFVSTKEGIYIKQADMEFKPFNTELLPTNKLVKMVEISSASHEVCPSDASKRKFLAATTDGLFLFNGKVWQPLYQGLETNDIRDLVVTQDTDVLAATDKGIFYLTTEQTFINDDQTLASRKFSEDKSFKTEGTRLSEPNIRQVQAWAIDYAEVNPEKILAWRSQARMKALLPNVNVGIDRDAGEVFHWDTGPNPDVLQKGRDLTDWGISVTWNLGELIWNNDQTSIDSRSKLMVELRQDILDQITRIYFERKRLTLVGAQLNDESIHQDMQLRIEELTALLDGYTGGRFSAALTDFH